LSNPPILLVLLLMLLLVIVIVIEEDHPPKTPNDAKGADMNFRSSFSVLSRV